MNRRPKVPRRGAALVLGGVALVLAGCGSEPAPALSVGPVGFTEDDLRGLSPTQQELLASLAALGVMVAEGRWAEMGAPRIEASARTLLAERLREEVMLEGAGVTEAELLARYQTRPDVELEVRHLVVLTERWTSDRAREEARERAARGLARIRAGEPFADVVADVSEEPGAAARGGLLRPGRQGTWVDEFWQAALRLDEGEVSGVVESPYGFHVLRLEARRPLPFEDARPRVVREVARGLGGGAAWEDAREAWLAELNLLPVAAAPRPQVTGEPFPTSVAAPDDGEAVLARWPGGFLTASAFVLHLASLPAGRVTALSDSTRLEEELRSAAELLLLAERAEARGLRLDDTDRAALVRAWEQEAGEWAGLLGFAGGMRPETVRERALAALRATGQNARIGRDGAASAAPTLLFAPADP